MGKIVSYLVDPIKTGVYHQKILIDFSGVSDYFKGLIENFEESIKTKRGLGKNLLEERLTKYSEVLNQLDGTSPWEIEYFEVLFKTFHTLARIDSFPEELAMLFLRERDIPTISGKYIKRKFQLPISRVPAIFESHLYPKGNDVVSIEKKYIMDKKWLFNVVTIKKATLSIFIKYLKCIPPINEHLKIWKEKKKFSSRYVFRPFPLVTKLWLKTDARILVPRDLKSFLEGAVRYIFSTEWRTSIVLSAITVESILADLYEEKFKKPAPDTPLGDLFRKVKERIDFPPEIVSAIEKTNKARIAAVHRSRSPVSDREATNALVGATNFTLWYTSET